MPLPANLVLVAPPPDPPFEALAPLAFPAPPPPPKATNLPNALLPPLADLFPWLLVVPLPPAKAVCIITTLPDPPLLLKLPPVPVDVV